MNGFSPSFYDGTHMLFQAMAKAGTVTDTDKVRAALESIKDYPGILGNTNWTGQQMHGINHQVDTTLSLSEVVKGQEVIQARCTTAGREYKEAARERVSKEERGVGKGEDNES